MKWAANGRWIDGAVIALLLVASLSFQVRAMLAPAQAVGGRSVAVLFAPWVTADSAMQRVAAAGARIVRFGAWPFIVIAEPDNVDFEQRIVTAGALVTLDPIALAACFKPTGAKR
jgi:hypothetical protein